jgi:hypothetical protein
MVADPEMSPIRKLLLSTQCEDETLSDRQHRTISNRERPSDDRSRGSRAIDKKEQLCQSFYPLQKESSAATSFACCVPVPCLVPCVKSRAVPISTAEVLVAS